MAASRVGALPLPSQEIHVWRIPLGAMPRAEERCSSLMAPDEVERAKRFRFEADRRRFVISRGALRTLLGRYLGIPPAEVLFSSGTRGKPCLDSSRGGAWLRFNLSHTDGLALVAVARDREVGVDIERVRPVPEVEEIVARHFSRPERDAFADLLPERRLATFFRWWTLKEAYLKARGEGLNGSLAECVLSASSAGEGAGPGWAVTGIDIQDGYVAALAAARPAVPFRLLDFALD